MAHAAMLAGKCKSFFEDVFQRARDSKQMTPSGWGWEAGRGVVDSWKKDIE
jgi:hypothetical protein